MTKNASNTSFTQDVARKATDLSWDDISLEGREIAAQCVLDWFGVAHRGSGEPAAQIVWQVASGDGGVPAASVIGRTTKLPLPQAALANGTAAHALDFDDTRNAVGHMSAPILSAVLAQAEGTGASGKTLLTAFYAGYEAACAIALAIGGGHYASGFHSTATIGIFGATVGCAKLLGLDQEGTRRAIGLAATQSAGLKAMFGTMGKPFHAGRAARDGLNAARLSAAGLVVNMDALDGDLGFISVLGRGDPHASSENFPFALRGNLFKFHAACHGTHAAINAAQRVRSRPGFDVSDVASVVIHAAPALEGVCNLTTPTSGLEIKFSLRYVVAMALADLDTSNPESYADDQPAVIAALPVTSVTRVELVPGMNRLHARVDVTLKSGERFSEASDASLPTADLAEQRAKLITKFNSLTAPRLEARRRDAFIAQVFDLAHCLDVGALFDLIQPGSAA